MNIVRWLRERLPHREVLDDHWHLGARVNRIYGLRPHKRLCIYDSTRAWFYTGQPAWVRIRVLGYTIYERNHHLSGLPGARK